MGRIDKQIRKRFPGKKISQSNNYLIIIDGKLCAISANADDIIKAFFSFVQSGRLQVEKISGFSVK